MTSGTFFQWENNRSKGVQATQTGGPPGFPMLAPRVESEGECFAPWWVHFRNALKRVPL